LALKKEEDNFILKKLSKRRSNKKNKKGLITELKKGKN
jgi:hypothetical protein